jgi:hypothetical protein
LPANALHHLTATVYDYKQLYDSMLKPAFLFDGRLILDHAKLQDIGFDVMPCIDVRLSHPAGPRYRQGAGTEVVVALNHFHNKESMSAAELPAWLAKMDAGLKDCVSFWMMHSLDKEKGGYFNCLDR